MGFLILIIPVWAVTLLALWGHLGWRWLMIICIVEAIPFLGAWISLWDDRENWFGNDGIDYRTMRLEAA